MAALDPGWSASGDPMQAMAGMGANVDPSTGFYATKPTINPDSTDIGTPDTTAYVKGADGMAYKVDAKGQLVSTGQPYQDVSTGRFGSGLLKTAGIFGSLVAGGAGIDAMLGAGAGAGAGAGNLLESGWTAADLGGAGTSAMAGLGPDAAGAGALNSFDLGTNSGLFPAGGGSSWLSTVGNALKSLVPSFGGTTGGTAAGLGSSPLGGAMSIGSGLYGMYLQNKQRQMAAQMNPWNVGGGQGAASDQLRTLLSDPSKIYSMPGWQAGQQAVQRTMGTMPGSGNMATALQKYGGDFYNNAVQQLSGLAGVGSGNQLQLAGTQGANALASQSLASLGYGGTQMTGGGVINPALLAQLKSMGYI